jgi:protein SCO1
MRRPRPTGPAILAALLAAGALAGCASSPANRGGSAGAQAPAANQPSASGYDGALLPASLPPRPFTLTDQRRRRVTLSDFKGRVAILAFLYTRSRTTAPLIAQQIRGALDELESERQPRAHSSGSPVALAISLDPSGDTPARVNAFLRGASFGGRLEYLTGAPAQLRAVWRAYGATPASAGARAYERSAFVLLLGRDGAARVEFTLEQLTPEALAHDVRRLQGEAG